MEIENVLLTSLYYAIFILPIVLPIALLFLIFNLWVSYARNKFISSQEYVLFRIIPPRDVFKTPLAMEIFINALFQTGGEGTPIAKFWHGKVRAWFSLEIVSLGGEVCFFIWTRKSLSGYLQSQIYAQYPGIEIFEVEDYMDKIDYENGNYSMFAAELGFIAPDPLPIKTYVDFGLDVVGEKDEDKVDPLTPTLEYLSTLRPGEFGMVQIIVRAHKKDEDPDPTKWFGKTDRWKDEAKELIIEIKKEFVYKDEKSDQIVNISTKGQQDKISAIERSLSKLPFDTGIRLMYLAEKDMFDPVNIGGILGVFKQFGSPSLNGFKPEISTTFDYWWQDPLGKKLISLKKNILETYIERDYFWKSLPKGKKRKKMILTSEELASIFHFPGSVAQNSSLTRVQSKRAEAPSNLPI
jgi:hypothetical protein